MPSLNPDDISASHDRNGTVQSLPKGQFVGPDYCLHDQIVPSASPKNQSPSPEAGHNQKLLANAPEDLTAFPQILSKTWFVICLCFPCPHIPLEHIPSEGRPEHSGGGLDKRHSSRSR
ncbi:hypothetical protein H4Q26_002553 [Puccinia striiformis f. sp. tritici PST-130]|nr:hypothetical protein H4Q26_002553 [Puccinia striiformis f. sp. tritici PST-130]